MTRCVSVAVAIAAVALGTSATAQADLNTRDAQQVARKAVQPMRESIGGGQATVRSCRRVNTKRVDCRVALVNGLTRCTVRIVMHERPGRSPRVSLVDPQCIS